MNKAPGVHRAAGAAALAFIGLIAGVVAFRAKGARNRRPKFLRSDISPLLEPQRCRKFPKPFAKDPEQRTHWSAREPVSLARITAGGVHEPSRTAAFGQYARI